MAGLEAGDRMLFSATTSLDLVIAHIAALRAGLVVVPANTAYRERELAHIVADSQPRAAFVDDSQRAAWVQSAADNVLVLGPGSELPEHEPAALDRDRRSWQLSNSRSIRAPAVRAPRAAH